MESENLKKRGKILKIIGITGTIFFVILEVLGFLRELELLSTFITASTFLYGEMTSLEGPLLILQHQLIPRRDHDSAKLY